MSKLYFKYGTVSSSKTANLIFLYHNFIQQNKNVILIKSAFDDRKKINVVYSRCGLEKNADIILKKEDIIYEKLKNYIKNFKIIDAIICDEAQFFSKEQIMELRNITIRENIPVFCFGLKTDYQSNLFEGSRELLSIADCIEEIKTICHFCDKKAIMNLKIIDGKRIYTGTNLPDIGFEDKYLPTCYRHYIS